MEHARAYAYHDRALHHVRRFRNRSAAAPSVAITLDNQPVRIAIAVVRRDGDATIGLRVTKLDDATRLAINALIANGDVPEDVDVHEVGPLFGFAAQDFVSPVTAGVACANVSGMRGTLGCFVRVNGNVCVLSANHVLALENQAPTGSNIVQPVNGALAVQTIGTLLDFESLTHDGNLFDGAIASVDLDSSDFDVRLFNGKHISSARTSPLNQGDRVSKFGQASEETSGRIFASTVSNVVIQMDSGQYGFDQQIEVVPDGDGPFSIRGDSGSLVYDDNDQAVGIVIGGNGTDRTYVSPIGALLTRFHAHLA